MTNSDGPYRNVYIRIDLTSIRHNLKCVKSYAPNSKVIAVVKADAYGHGMSSVLPALNQADAFAVATIDEALAIRRTGERKPVMVFQGFRTDKQLQDCISADLWPVIHDDHQLKTLSRHSASGLSSWVKFDTGMGRLGFHTHQCELVRSALKAASVNVVGIMSHMACADNIEDLSNDRQLREFLSIEWPGEVARSLANSAALLSRQDSQLDWVRPGIMLYGASPFDSTSPFDCSSFDSYTHGLQPAMRVTAPVIAIRDLKRGQRIGYAGRYQCNKDMKVAVVGAGYGDGYPRAVPDLTSVMFGNRRCSVVGRISMDSMVVDITTLTVPPPLDYPVTLWGHEQLRVDEIAASAGTIPYELLCRIRGQRQWIDAKTELNVSKIDKDWSMN